MIKKLCSYPGCHKVVEAGVKYCDKHRETDRKKYREYKQCRMRDEQEARRQQFYNSKAWEQFRAAQAAAQLGIDIYEYYTTGRIIDAENYHHIQEIALIFSWNEKPTEVFTYIIPTAGGVFGAAVIWYLKAVQLENGIKIQLGMIKKLIDLGEENPAEEIKERTIQKMKDKTEALIDEALEPTEIQNF